MDLYLHPHQAGNSAAYLPYDLAGTPAQFAPMTGHPTPHRNRQPPPGVFAPERPTKQEQEKIAAQPSDHFPLLNPTPPEGHEAFYEEVFHNFYQTYVHSKASGVPFEALKPLITGAVREFMRINYLQEPLNKSLEKLKDPPSLHFPTELVLPHIVGKPVQEYSAEEVTLQEPADLAASRISEKEPTGLSSPQERRVALCGGAFSSAEDGHAAKALVLKRSQKAKQALLYDAAPPNDQDSQHMANLAICAKRIFRIPRPSLFCHSANDPYRRMLSNTTRRFSLTTNSGIAYFRFYVRFLGDLDARLGLLDPGQPLRYLKSIFGPPTASLRMLLAQFATIATSTPQTRHLANAPCDEACLLAADALRRREILRA
ncbi:hypothetical protein C6P46_002391 [Rhodotorula mucilaginosa]|uniref:Uncharacterized protein n=1 Tax=Rhodotorula mucilaginosa TaxID=5537 RepID=A0A9P6VSJ1_RHOMI|nr:hypothetical protein C6P46_002391 [Rhodotorula mucilaginosa]